MAIIFHIIQVKDTQSNLTIFKTIPLMTVILLTLTAIKYRSSACLHELKI